MKIDISDKLYSDIVEYCKTNNIDDVNKFIKKIINQGFTTEKWGTLNNKESKKEIVEKIIISAITVQPEIQIVEKIIISAVTNQEVVKKIVTDKTDNVDLYGERNVRKI